MTNDNDWPFPDAPSSNVLTVRTILEGKPILFVEHDERGHWHFFDGRTSFPGDELVLVPFAEIVALDPNLSRLSQLPAGWRAFRSNAQGTWEKETRQNLELTRAKTKARLEELRRNPLELPPGSPDTTELLREARGQ